MRLGQHWESGHLGHQAQMCPREEQSHAHVKCVVTGFTYEQWTPVVV